MDLSADFRLKDAAEYPRWYDFNHPAPELLPVAVYGLTELHRSEVAAASLVANPGCYPTGAILALAPAVKAGLIDPDIIVDSKSGVSGAGRSPTLGTHYCRGERERLGLCSGRAPPSARDRSGTGRVQRRRAVSVTFLPHLVPMTRGILSSCYARLVKGRIAGGQQGTVELRHLYRDFYKDEPFVRVVDAPPQTKQTWGSNLCLIYPTIDLRTDRLIVISCLDNLVKGGAGQAIQNMNLMLGFPETMGLEALPVFP